ncbi:MAG: hypothetical protein HQ564_10475 [Candidatus Saganbacteria bacterium]|nr:hypothetical protein [Candidatus Saganbacteria bacterium]
MRVTRHVISYDFIRAVKIRAIPLEGEGAFYGAVSMSGQRGHTRLKGVCMSLEGKGGDVFVDQENPYFYGTKKDLIANFRRIPFRDSHLERLVDRTISLHVSREHQSVRVETARFLIPLDLMRLSAEYAKLKDEVTTEVVANLPEWISRWDEVVLENDPRVLHFSFLPGALKKDAFEKGSFFVFNVSRRNKFDQLLELPRARMVYSPIGGMPRWMKDFVRRGGKP